MSSLSTPSKVISMHGNSQEQRELARGREEDGLVREDLRFFFEDGITADEYTVPEMEGKPQLQEDLEDEKTMERLRNEMAPLENLERTLADQYEMGRDLDSVEVLDETRARVLDHRVSQWELDKLVRLQSLRCDLSAIEQKSSYSSRSFSNPLPQVDPSRFWAVLIGIDGYHFNSLNGCVSDALAMKMYLIEDLDVPEEHIQCLLGHKPADIRDALIPTRENIIETICGLIDNPNISKGDVIIIYFAGVGARIPCPDIYQQGGVPDGSTTLIECLIPVDATIGMGINDLDPSLLISDREINSILTEICREKGHRITFIVDSNYTGGFRYFPDIKSTHSGMGDHSIKTMFDVADKHLNKFPGYVSISSRNWYPDMGSYVTLTGCQESQVAMEMNGKGIFTNELLHTLRSTELKSTLNYLDLLHILPFLSDHQNPFGFGKHLSHRLWYQD